LVVLAVVIVLAGLVYTNYGYKLNFYPV
jgi:hypothetical protein